jgi:hypothetical protein
VSKLEFDPILGMYVALTPDGRVDPEGDDIHAVEYIRTILAWVRYRETNVHGVGEVIAYGTMASGVIEELKASGDKLIVVDREPANEARDVYVDIGSEALKPRAPSSAILDGLVLRSLPPGAAIRIDMDAVYEVESDTVELEFDMPGTYRVEVRAPMHHPVVYEVRWP